MKIEEKIKQHQELGVEIANYYFQEDSILHRNLFTKIIEIKDCEANDYNPNVMPKKEMNLLWECIDTYGFLFPDLVWFDEDKKKYIIVDGFHRLESLRRQKKKYISVIDMSYLTLEERMQLTVLMNRIKGMHKVESMSNLVVKLSSLGMNDIEIINNLGMEAEEYIRLKQQLGLGVASYYRNHNYSKSWEVNK